MKSEMLGSETSSEESDQQAVQNDSAGTKRSYDCTFCKRGFPNARALGGHMNIHRKERAKAKQGTPKSSLPNFTNEESMAPPFFTEVSSQPSSYYSISESHQRNYDMYFQPPVPNPRNHPPAYTFQYEFINPWSQPQALIKNQELLGTNLSLQIGPGHVDANQVRGGIQKDGEVVDLELRLGHESYSNY